MKSEWILTGGGPESEEGQEGPFQERKEGKKRVGHGKAGVESKQFGLGQDWDVKTGGKESRKES